MCYSIHGVRMIRFLCQVKTTENPLFKRLLIVFNKKILDYQNLEEYILADTTLVWRGSYNRLRPSVWKVGQFERNVLDCSLLLISTIGKVSAAHRGDPVKISRALSAAVNSPDDDGALLGNWSEDFAGGTPPTKWIGSVAILQEYYRKRKPVKYGQCWVFSGVLTTSIRLYIYKGPMDLIYVFVFDL